MGCVFQGAADWRFVEADWGSRVVEDRGRRDARGYSASLGNIEVKPSLLHGDLCSGNARYSRSTSAPITFDPGSYYGDSEAELGIMHMFGGFTSAFFKRYHELVPKIQPVEDYGQRIQLYELYHHLNHTLLFERSHRTGALSIMRKLVKVK